MIEYCKTHNIDVEASASKPYSMDRNLWHISYEAGILEDPWFDPTTPDNREMYKLSVDPEIAPDDPEYIELSFNKGNCIAINGEKLSAYQVISKLNKIAGKHGIGRVDLVENRFVGMKSRGVYETPGGTILLHAHRQIETLTMDRDLMHLRDSLVPRFAELIYYGFWFAPEREALQALIDKSQESVSGSVRLKLYKGNVITVGRKSDQSLYDEGIASMDDDESDYQPEDAGGFIRLNALRLKERNRKQGFKV
jgi:argininosuccinate synthase